MSGVKSIAVKLHINEITPSDLFLAIVPVLNTLFRSCDRTEYDLKGTQAILLSLPFWIKKSWKYRLFTDTAVLSEGGMLLQKNEVNDILIRRHRILVLPLHTLGLSL